MPDKHIVSRHKLIIFRRKCLDGSIDALNIIQFHPRRRISCSYDLYVSICGKVNYSRLYSQKHTISIQFLFVRIFFYSGYFIILQKFAFIDKNWTVWCLSVDKRGEANSTWKNKSKIYNKFVWFVVDLSSMLKAGYFCNTQDRVIDRILYPTRENKSKV